MNTKILHCKQTRYSKGRHLIDALELGLMFNDIRLLNTGRHRQVFYRGCFNEARCFMTPGVDVVTHFLRWPYDFSLARFSQLLCTILYVM